MRDLFKDVRYYAVGNLSKEVKNMLANGKAKMETYLSALATHVIVSDPTNYEAEAAQEVWQIPTVKPSWVLMSVECKKLLPTNAFSPSLKQLFSNVTVCFSQIPKKDKASMWGLITYNGGSCQSSLNKQCTHLIVPTPTGAKYEESVKRATITIVTPDWIMKSVQEKQLQPPDTFHPKLNIIPSPPKAPSPVEKKKEEAVDNMKNLSVSDALVGTKPTSETLKIISQNKDVATMLSETQRDLLQKQPPSLLMNSAQTPAVSQRDTAQVEEKQGVFIPRPALQFPSQVATPQMRFSSTVGQTRPGLVTVSPSNVRFSVPNVPGQRSPMPQAAMASSAPHFTGSQQSDMMAHPNQVSQLNVLLPEQQQRAMMSPGSPYMVMSPTLRMSGSPRRNSSQQSTGGKKKKSSSHANRSSPHSASHPMTHQFPANSQAMFSSPQQQMMPKHRMTSAGGMPAPGIGDGTTGGQPGIPRFHAVPGRFGNPAMVQQQDENMQHMHQQQLMQMQQQQMQRMMIRQGQPGMTGPMGQGQMGASEAMQLRWPRPSADGTFPAKPPTQPAFSPHAPQSSAMTRPPGQPSTPQGNIQAMSGQQSMPPQHYNPSMGNRYPSPMNPQEQQMMFQQMQRSPAQRFPTSTSLEAAGISGISPVALQQGLLNAAQMQADNPPLIHPSLQGTLFPKVPTSSQSPGGTVAPKKRTKSRRKTDGGDDEPKNRPRQRTSKAKKNPTTSTPMTSVMMQSMTPMMSQNMASHSQFPPEVVKMMSPVRPSFLNMPSATSAGFALPQTMAQVGNPSATYAQPVSFMQATNAVTQNHLRTTTNHATQVINQPVPETTRDKPVTQVTSHIAAPTVENADQIFVDPLTYSIKEIDAQYHTRDPTDLVPSSLFLLGCIFHIVEYDEVVSDVSVIQLWKKMIEKYGGIVEKHYQTSCTHLLCVTCTTNIFKQAIIERKRCVTVYWLNDVLQLRKLRVPWLALHVPTRFSHKLKPALNHVLSYTGFHHKERERLKMMGLVCGVKFTGYLSRNHTGLLCKGTGSVKFNKASTWKVPRVTSLWLRDLLHSDGSSVTDMTHAKYHNFSDDSVAGFALDLDKCRQLLESWKAYIPLSQDCLERVPLKRELSSISPNPTLPKRARIIGPLPRVCFTGIPPAFVQGLKQKLESVRGRCETTFALCSHLVAQNVSRTVKFLSCISSCRYIVTPDWIEESAKKNQLLNEKEFLLVDKIAEEKFKFSLTESMERANESLLFKDCLFCATPNVIPARKALAQIIECAGGRLLNKIPSTAVLNHMKERKSPNKSIFIISCPEDEAVYNPLKKEGLHIHNAELVLTGVLKQELDVLSYRL